MGKSNIRERAVHQGGWKSPSGIQKQSPVEAWGVVLQKLVICKVNLDPLLQLCTLKEQTIFLQLILILDNDGRDAMGSVRTKRTAAEFATGRTCPCNVANVDFSVYQTYLIHFAIRAVHRDPLLLYSVRCQPYFRS